MTNLAVTDRTHTACRLAPQRRSRAPVCSARRRSWLPASRRAAMKSQARLQGATATAYGCSASCITPGSIMDRVSLWMDLRDLVDLRIFIMTRRT